MKKTDFNYFVDAHMALAGMYLQQMFYKGAGVGEIVSNVHLSQLPIIEPDIRSSNVPLTNSLQLHSSLDIFSFLSNDEVSLKVNTKLINRTPAPIIEHCKYNEG